MFRTPQGSPIWVPREPFRTLFERATIAEDSGATPPVLVLDDVLARVHSRDPVAVDDIFERMTKADLKMEGPRVGLSDDFTGAVVLVQTGRALVVPIDASRDMDHFFEDALGYKDFLDVMRRSPEGRRAFAELRRIVRGQSPPSSASV